jgi:uncharacterized membrane protein (DUF441 family)
MNGEILLVILIITGLLGKSSVITTAASLLLIFKLTSLERFFPTIERRGLELGLLFLTVAVLVPFANGSIGWDRIYPFFISMNGWLALLGGAVAVYMNRFGLNLIRTEPQIIIGLVIGSIFGILFLKGIPVGPLTAAGMTAIFAHFYKWRK